jgi:hypothetical protein
VLGEPDCCVLGFQGSYTLNPGVADGKTKGLRHGADWTTLDAVSGAVRRQLARRAPGALETNRRGHAERRSGLSLALCRHRLGHAGTGRWQHPLISLAEPSRRYLLFAEREEIAILKLRLRAGTRSPAV